MLVHQKTGSGPIDVEEGCPIMAGATLFLDDMGPYIGYALLRV